MRDSDGCGLAIGFNPLMLFCVLEFGRIRHSHWLLNNRSERMIAFTEYFSSDAYKTASAQLWPRRADCESQHSIAILSRHIPSEHMLRLYFSSGTEQMIRW